MKLIINSEIDLDEKLRDIYWEREENKRRYMIDQLRDLLRDALNIKIKK